jgi:hypothetical protein
MGEKSNRISTNTGTFSEDISVHSKSLISKIKYSCHRVGDIDLWAEFLVHEAHRRQVQVVMR